MTACIIVESYQRHVPVAVTCPFAVWHGLHGRGGALCGAVEAYRRESPVQSRSTV